MSEWISVEDRLPEGIWHTKGCSLMSVIAARYNKHSEVNPYEQKYRVEQVLYDDSEKAFYLTNIGGLSKIDDVTHWMPLPDPPEDV